MSAPPSQPPALSASLSSSGYADGLGRRSISFDREDGTMLERLIVRPELAAFEPALRDRLERLGAVDDERIARPRAIVRDADAGLVVVSEFVPGSRLADLLESALARGIVPGVDVAFGFLLDVLPALCGLHAGAGFTHGAIAPGRIVITPAGQVVLLDAVFGGALGCLGYSRPRLWAEFDLAVATAAGPVRFDASTDIAQAALAAVMLVTGRPVERDEFPDMLPALVLEVVDVAMIRGSAEFATGLQSFLQRALPLSSGRGYASADDALIDLRDLAGELGAEVCRRALVDFVDQIEGSGEADIAEIEAFSEEGEDDDWETAAAPGDDGSLADRLGLSVEEEGEDDEIVEIGRDDAEEIEAEPAVYDLSSSELTDDFLTFEPTVRPPRFDVFPAAPWAEEPGPLAAADSPVDEGLDTTPARGPQPAVEAGSDPTPDEATTGQAGEAAPPEADGGGDARALSASAAAAEPDAARAEAEPVEEASSGADVTAAEAPDEVPAAPPTALTGARRRKRTRSVKTRKDRLRSATAAPAALAAAPPPDEPEPAKPAPAPAPAKTGWLVSPDRAASFEPPIPDPIAAPPPPSPVMPQARPFVPVAPVPFLPEPVPAVTVPAIVSPLAPPPIAQPAPWNPVAVQAAPPAAPLRPIAAAPASPPLKLKTTPVRVQNTRATRPAPVADIYTPAPVQDDARRQGSGSFPWKLMAAAAALIVIGVAGRPYLEGRLGPKTDAGRKAAPSTAAAAEPARPATSVPAKGMGRLEIETQPAGARVLLDGRFEGESPLTLEAVSAGRHTLTFESGAGTLRRTVRVEAGRTQKVDVPIYSGWVGIFAPIVLDVATRGQSIGTTEEARLMLPPGRHELTLSNKELGYSTVQTVEIEPGEVRSLTLDPRGSVNVNAIPWAEVWIDGRKVGDTPIANLQLPLGIRDIVFKHPQFGERRTTVTVKANPPAAITVDMGKP